MREVDFAKQKPEGEKRVAILSLSFAINQQPPRQRGPWAGIIDTPHVLVSDPAMDYGVFDDNMLNVMA